MERPSALNTILRKTASKIVKARYFSEIQLTKSHISFKHHGRVFSFQLLYNKLGDGIFRSGYVTSGIKSMPTYESGYNDLKPVEVAHFNCDSQNRTDNPDFIFRQAMDLIGIARPTKN